MTVPQAEYDALVAHLEDTQASLAAALARVEAFRLKQRVLVQEIAKLRLTGVQSPSPQPSSPPQQPPSPPRQQPPPPPPQQQQQQDTPAADSSTQPSASGKTEQQAHIPLPCYITEVEAHLPVLLVQGGRKVPGSVVVTDDFIDFVDIRARIRRNQFTGFTAATVSGRRPTATPPAWKQLIPCLTPGAEGPTSPDARAARPRTRPASGGGGSSSHPASPAASAGEGSSLHRPYGRHNSWGGGGGGGGSSATESPRRALEPPPRHVSGAVPRGTSDEPPAALPPEPHMGAWQVLWSSGGVTQQLVFEATPETRELLHRHTEEWLGLASSAGSAEEDLVVPPSRAGGDDDGDIEMAVPRHLVPGAAAPRLCDPSALLSQAHVRLLGEAVPGRFRGRAWALLYSTARHGISLQTLYRRASGVAPSVLVLQDGGGALFGCYASDPWKVGSRFYGAGETFVFQLLPHALMYPWKVKSAAKNDFFMYSTGECLAVGGLGRFAIWLDSELSRGSSGRCGTFGSPCLGSSDEFSIVALELWGLGA